MAPAASAVRSALETVEVAEPRFAVVSNVDAHPNSDRGRIADLLIRQVDSPVLWDQSVRVMVEQGVERALEVGSGNVLSGLVKRIDKRLRVWNVNSSEAIAKTAEFLDG
jgi:[acyl-carrier-protein] S-malonyltransferase